MTINPVLTIDRTKNELIPLPQPDELFYLRRDGVKFDCVLPGSAGKLKASGVCVLSSTRIVFIAKEKTANRADFGSFEIPFGRDVGGLVNPQFKQPIFGANYLQGEVQCAQFGGGTAKASLTFTSGGCDTFLQNFFRVFGEAQLQGQAAPFSAGFRQNPQHTAFVDPNDPSVLYISQPTPSAPPLDTTTTGTQ